MKLSNFFVALLASVFCLVAQSGIISAVDSGAYDINATHLSDNETYIVGDCEAVVCGNTNSYRNFLVFDLSGLGPLSAVTLRLDAALVIAPGTFSLWDVSSDIASLRAGGASLFNIYEDLREGSLFGSISLLESDTLSVIEINLNSSAIASINSNSGLWAVGGSYDGWAPAFAFSDSNSLRQLEFVESASIPEPSIILLMSLGVVGLIYARKINSKV